MLSSALTAVHAGDHAAALRHLLDAWRELRAPGIADLIDLVSRRIERPAIEGKTVHAFFVAWLDIQAAHDPADLPRLLAPPWPKNFDNQYNMANQLSKRPDDPRMCAPFVELVATLPRYTWTTRSLWTVLLGKIAEIGDVRAVPHVRRLLEKPDLCRLHETVHQTLHALSEVTFTEPDLAELESALASEQPKQRSVEGDLLEAIRANPDDTGALAVYADTLVERGDSLGELLVLQLQRGSGVPTKREQQLLGQHGARLAGTLARYLDLGSIEYERGFVAGGVLHQDLDVNQLYTVLKDPAWRTVKRLAGHPRRAHSAYHHGAIAELVLDSALERLTALHDLGVGNAAKLLGALAKHHHPPIEELSVALYASDSSAPFDLLTDALAEDRCLKRVGVLPNWQYGRPDPDNFYAPYNWVVGWFVAPPAQLEELIVTGAPENLPGWLRAHRRGARPSIAFTLMSSVTHRDLRRPEGWRFRLADRVLRVEWHATRRHTADLAVLDKLATELEPGTLTRFEVARSRALAIETATRDRIAKRLETLGVEATL